MTSDKFTVSYNVTSGWRKIFLTCPQCNHHYPLYHAYCGTPLDIEDALESHRCSSCYHSGYERDAILAVEVADCPQCGCKCRTMGDVEDIDYPKIVAVHKIRRKRLPSIVKQHLPQKCEACGFTSGLEVHHKDWNHRNNNPENLQVLCKWCHVQAKKLGKPEFERMLEKVESDSSLKIALCKTAADFYNKLSAKNKFGK